MSLTYSYILLQVTAHVYKGVHAFAADFLGPLFLSQKNCSIAMSTYSKPLGDFPNIKSHAIQVAVTDSIAAVKLVSTNTTFH